MYWGPHVSLIKGGHRNGLSSINAMLRIVSRLQAQLPALVRRAAPKACCGNLTHARMWPVLCRSAAFICTAQSWRGRQRACIFLRQAADHSQRDPLCCTLVACRCAEAGEYIIDFKLHIRFALCDKTCLFGLTALGVEHTNDCLHTLRYAVSWVTALRFQLGR